MEPDTEQKTEKIARGLRAVFLDRDGVLNEEIGYITRPQDLRLIAGAAEAVARLNAAGWPVFVFTNQSGVGRGYLTLDDLEAIHTRLRSEIALAGGHLHGIYACPHAPDEGCACRKPLPGLLHRAAVEQGLDLARCVVVGDSARDIHAGHAAGCRTALVLTGHTKTYHAETFSTPLPDRVFASLFDVADWLTVIELE